MCSRYELNASPRDLVDRFDLFDSPDVAPRGSRGRPPHLYSGGTPPVAPRAEIRPTNLAPVIDGAHRLWMAQWGLAVSWDTKPLINARAETLERKKSFRPLLASRCLVPATAYFEWRRDGSRRLKNRIAPADGGLFAFAGLTDGERFTIVTCAPAAPIAHIHDRMPVILEADGEAAWLDGARPFADVKPLLAPFAAALAASEQAPRQPDLFAEP